MTQVVLHMGYVRTATTTHQRHVFSAHEHIFYLGKPFPNDNLKLAFRNLVCRDEASFDPVTSNALLKKSVEEGRSAACVLLSDEIMLGPAAVDISILLKRLREVVDDKIKVLLTIREQSDLFRSWAEHVLEKSEYSSLDVIARYHWKFRETRESLLSYLDYAKYYSYFCRALGRDQILALPFELMRSDLSTYCKILASFLGVSEQSMRRHFEGAPTENARGEKLQISFIDYKKRRSVLNPRRTLDLAALAIFQMSSGATRLQEQMQQLQRRLRLEFATKNRPLREALLRDIGVDIADLGYCVSKESSDG
jgi:hypothetical protein